MKPRTVCQNRRQGHNCISHTRSNTAQNAIDAAKLKNFIGRHSQLERKSSTYTALMPELIRQQWFQESQAVYLGAAALVGYLIGALSAHRISERMPTRLFMGLCFLSITLSYIFSSQPGFFEWFLLWRLVAGAAGAILMVVGPATALVATPASRRADVGAFVFSGIGLGIVMSATVIPALIKYNLSITWLVLGGLSLIAGVTGHQCLCRLTSTPQSQNTSSASSDTIKNIRWPLILVMAAYGLDAAGFIPHTIFRKP